jgi:O-antigen ligase
VNARSLSVVVVATLAGVVIGLIVGYIPSLLVYGLVAGATQGTISQTGGWAEAGTIGGVVWLACAGFIVGLFQQRALPPRSRAIWWAVALAAVWGASHVINIVVRGLPGDVDLNAIFPALVVVSLIFGIAALRLAGRSSRS